MLCVFRKPPLRPATVNLPEPLAAVVLAAGIGSRMGGAVKPLIQINGRTIVQGLVQGLAKAGIQHIEVVISSHTLSVRQKLIEAHGSWTAGLAFTEVTAGCDQMVSLYQGLRKLVNSFGAVVICLADQPRIDRQAISELIAAFATRPRHTDMLVPCVNGQPGNPVMLSSQLVQEWLRLEARQIGKAWRQSHPQRVHHWPTRSTAYIDDLDTQHDLQAFCSSDLRRTL